MPRDLDGATAWGIRLGLISQTSAQASRLEPRNEAPRQSSAIELEELRLKSARADMISLDLDLKSGRLIRLEDVEQRELANAAEFRRVACEYPSRARAIIERHVHDGALVDRIIGDLQPLAGELLNKSDIRKILDGKTPAERRSLLISYAETLAEKLA